MGKWGEYQAVLCNFSEVEWGNAEADPNCLTSSFGKEPIAIAYENEYFSWLFVNFDYQNNSISFFGTWC